MASVTPLASEHNLLFYYFELKTDSKNLEVSVVIATKKKLVLRASRCVEQMEF